jgi:hypothetical protein
MEKKKKQNRWIILIVLLIGALVYLAFWLFGGEKVAPQAPPPTQLDTTILVPRSELIFPVNFEVKELSELLNVAISGTFFKAPLTVNERGDIVELEIKRSAPLRISWQMPYLEMTVPLHLSGIGRIKVGKGMVSNREPVESDLVLTLRSHIDISSDWKLITQSTVKQITWINDPIVKIAFLRLNLRNRVDEAIHAREAELLKNIDSKVGEKIELKKAVTKIWCDIQKPLRVNKKEILIWLRNRCDSITARLVDKGSQMLSVQVACYAQSKIYFGNDTAVAINTTLPPYVKSDKDLEDRVELYIGIRIPFKLLNKKLEERIGEPELSFRNYKVKVKKLEVYGTDSALAMKVKLRGDVKGDIYLTAKIFFDPLTNYIGVNEVAYDINTENTLVQTADWVFHDSLPALINRKLRIPLDSLTSKIPLLLGKGIENSKVGEKLDANILINDISLHDLVITRSDIQLIALARAKAAIQIEKAAFSGKVKPLRIKSVKKKVK